MKNMSENLGNHLPTAIMFPNVNMTANLIGLAKTISDCTRKLNSKQCIA
jgi:hypothetical protein